MESLLYNFVIPDKPGESLDELACGCAPRTSRLLYQGEFAWGHQTYLYLKQLGMNVALSLELNPDAVNLAHGNVLRALKNDPRCFCVSLQADFPCYPLAHYHIVQNKDQIGRNASFVPHWPLPGQNGRNPDRAGVEKVAYQGAGRFTDLDERCIHRDLEKHGIAFEILSESQWTELQEVDVLLGIRNFGKKQYKRKPPTKLINAWHAGIPLIGGWDSAYRQIGKPGQDYLRVASYKELLACIVRLKDDPVLYNRLVMTGRRQARLYTPSAIADHWRHLLEMDVAPAYRVWKQQPMQMLEFRIATLRESMNTSGKSMLKSVYRIPGVKLLRDRYYDPK